MILFSALDYRTDAILRRRLKEVTQDATVLIVAQVLEPLGMRTRLSSLIRVKSFGPLTS